MKSLTDTDIAVILSGRNKHVYTDILKEFRLARPRLRIRERTYISMRYALQTATTNVCMYVLCMYDGIRADTI